MKAFILVDENKIVRCIASEECNLHKDKLHMKTYYVETKGIVGDEYNPKTNEWISRPENYPKPPAEEVAERLIQERMQEIIRNQAIKELQSEGKI